jgi:hypothetical protein
MDLTKLMLSDVRDPSKRVGPARSVHIDFSPQGATGLLRHKSQDIISEARDIIEAEDKALASGNPYEGRRYAIYNIWRPLKTVRKDPLILCDPGSIDRGRDLIEFVNEYPSINGDFLNGLYMLSGFHAEQQKWFWIREPKEDEVYFLQFYDCFAEREGSPVGVPHESPDLVDVEGGEVRESVETRVIAFW